MRIAVITDIHSNLEAFRSVLQRITMLDVDRTVCLGDIVGYGADPDACVETARQEGVTSILGNHDAAASGLEEPEHFNPPAREAVLWTRTQLSRDNREFLRNLPRELGIGDCFFCHGSLHDTNRYIFSADDVREAFNRFPASTGTTRICFFGHTHVKIAFSSNGRDISQELDEQLVIDPQKRYLVNPGSAGQPRDRDPRAAFLVYDQGRSTVTFHRVEYDIPLSQNKILRAGLPRRLAERLAHGL